MHHPPQPDDAHPVAQRLDLGSETELPAHSLADLEGAHGLEIDGYRVRFAVDTEHLDLAVSRLAALRVRSLVGHPPTLEELFLRHYGDELAKEPERVEREREPERERDTTPLPR